MAFKLDRRAHGRKQVNVLATLMKGSEILSCHIVELSDAGARVKLANEEAAVEGRARLVSAEYGTIETEIVWQKGALVGLRFVDVPKRASGVPGAPKL